MLEKHKDLIEKNLNNREYMVESNSLKIILDNKKEINNIVVDNKSIWYIGNLVITVDRIDIGDSIGLITIAAGVEFINIKILATEVYVEYQARNVQKYGINSFNLELILNIIEDFNNRRHLINQDELKFLNELINDDIKELFNIIAKNRETYIDEYNHELNNLRAEFVIKEDRLNRKIKSLVMYPHTNWQILEIFI